MKQIQPKHLEKRQREAIREMRETMLSVVGILQASMDNYDRAMASTPPRYDVTFDEAMEAMETGESWQIGDHEFDEMEVEE